MSQLGYHEQIKARAGHLRKVMDEIMASEPASDHGPAHEAWLTEMADALCRLGELRSRLGMEIGDWDPPGIDGAFARGILLAARVAQSTSHLTHPFGVLRLAAKADPLLVNVRRHIAEWVNGQVEKLGLGRKAKKPSRRRQPTREARPITPKEVEAVQLVGQHKGNVAAAARQAGKSRTAMKKLYDKAHRKLASVKTPKGEQMKTRRLPTDRRGQATVEDRGEVE
jgi:predicted DNA-binding protein (UPF0251 family)